MDRLFPAPEFSGFGPSSQDLVVTERPLVVVRAARSSGLRTLVRRDAGRQPGVYGMIDGTGRLLYVGKAKALRLRLLSYFRTKSRDPKAARILGLTRSIVWEPCPHEFAALIRELELIRRWRPHFNVRGKPTRQRPTYICVGRQPAPQLFLSRVPPVGVLASFGPLMKSDRLSEAVRRLNDHFGLRDCPRHQEMVFADQKELFPVARSPGCLRYEIGTCLGPCFAACTRSGYRKQVHAACAFLNGLNEEPLNAMRTAMAKASQALEFERAAIFRERLDLFDWLGERLKSIRTARQGQSFVYRATGANGDPVWFAIHKGRVVSILKSPRTKVERQRTLRALHAIYGPERIGRSDLAAQEIDHVLLIGSWFRHHPEEQARCSPPSEVLEELAGAAAGDAAAAIR
jgi:excinuclease ABC subunit C